MKVTQEKLPASQVGLEIEITPEMSKQVYEKTIRDFSRNLNIPGFRKGKVPRHVLIQRIGTRQIKLAALEELVESSLKQAIEQENIDAIGNIQLKSSFEDLAQQFEPEGGLRFSVAVDVPPDVHLENYQGLTIQAEEVVYDPADVDKVLEDYRQRTATLVPIEDRAAQMGDVAIVDFRGVYTPVEGEEPVEIPGGSAEDFHLELQTGQFIEGFVEAVVGARPGETVEFEITFPEDYPQAEVAGKPAHFSVAINELKEKDLPDLDDDFAEEISEFETLDALREHLENRFKSEADQKTKQNKADAILNELVKHLDVDLPETLISREVDFLVTQTAMRLESQGLDVRKIMDDEILAGMRDRTRPDAIARIRRTLALGEIAKQQNIEVDSDELRARSTALIQKYPDQDLDPERVRQVMEDEILEEMVMAWLEEHNTIEMVPEGSLTSDSEGAEDSEGVEAETVETEPTGAEPAEETSSPEVSEASSATDEASAAEAIPDIVDVTATAVEATGVETPPSDASTEAPPPESDSSATGEATDATATVPETAPETAPEPAPDSATDPAADAASAPKTQKKSTSRKTSSRKKSTKSKKAEKASEADESDAGTDVETAADSDSDSES